jgi:GNAT superfamily N-acetyltransferase
MDRDQQQRVELRLLHESDDLAELTELLHRAYRPLADAGMRFLASHQDEQKTRERIADGECWVATVGTRIVGTIVMYSPTQSHGCPWYERDEVAQFGQFAVEPDMQGHGIGSQLLNHVEQRARETGARELALDTSERATHLIAYYTSRGYWQVETVKWDVVNYSSIVMSKRLSRS